MSAWDEQTSPLVKFESSPAESFMSAPGDMYPSLFAATTPTASTSSTMNPLEVMTPRSYTDDCTTDVSVLAGLSVDMDMPSTPSAASTPGAEKKQAKKRKSWGQVLPEPKTNLPPRKRAKTEDEKEQRRVERVLRNRRAAQSSRERKRLEVEALEQRNQELEVALLNVQKANLLLVEELNKFRRNSGVVSRSSNPVTLSQELFSSQDGHQALPDQAESSLMDDLVLPTAPNATVNPASLSPELHPIPDAASPDDEDAEPANDSTTASAAAAEDSPDLTQRPAAMLCDLQCHQSTELPRSWQASQSPLAPALLFFLQLETLLTTSSVILSVCRRPLTQIAMSLKAGFSLPPTPSILNTIIWLVTLPPSSRPTRPSTSSTSTSTSTTRCTAAPSQRIPSPSSVSPTLRLKSLQRILTCSPNLARPLMDATMEALRLVSEGCESGAEGPSAESRVARDGGSSRPQWLYGTALPSREVLLTLLWALKVEERKTVRREQVFGSTTAVPKSGSRINTPTSKYILRMSPTKRRRGEGRGGRVVGRSRSRLG